MKGALFSLLRWVVYIIFIFTIPALLQVSASIVSSLDFWQFWFFVYIMIGWTLALVIMYGIASICPLPKYPNLLFVGFFIVAECSYLYFNGPGSTWVDTVLRLGTDTMITIGVLAGAISPLRYKELNKNT